MNYSEIWKNGWEMEGTDVPAIDSRDTLALEGRHWYAQGYGKNRETSQRESSMVITPEEGSLSGETLWPALYLTLFSQGSLFPALKD